MNPPSNSLNSLNSNSNIFLNPIGEKKNQSSTTKNPANELTKEQVNKITKTLEELTQEFNKIVANYYQNYRLQGNENSEDTETTLEDSTTSKYDEEKIEISSEEEEEENGGISEKKIETLSLTILDKEPSLTLYDLFNDLSDKIEFQSDFNEPEYWLKIISNLIDKRKSNKIIYNNLSNMKTVLEFTIDILKNFKEEISLKIVNKSIIQLVNDKSYKISYNIIKDNLDIVCQFINWQYQPEPCENKPFRTEEILQAFTRDEKLDINNQNVKISFKDTDEEPVKWSFKLVEKTLVKIDHGMSNAGIANLICKAVHKFEDTTRSKFFLAVLVTECNSEQIAIIDRCMQDESSFWLPNLYQNLKEELTVRQLIERIESHTLLKGFDTLSRSIKNSEESFLKYAQSIISTEKTVLNELLENMYQEGFNYFSHLNVMKKSLAEGIEINKGLIELNFKKNINEEKSKDLDLFIMKGSDFLKNSDLKFNLSGNSFDINEAIKEFLTSKLDSIYTSLLFDLKNSNNLTTQQTAMDLWKVASQILSPLNSHAEYLELEFIAKNLNNN